MEGYRTIVPRFCSEFGQQSPAAIETLTRAISDSHFRVGSQSLAHRQRATGGTAKHIDGAISDLFAVKGRFLKELVTFEDWWRAAQIAQEESMKIGIEWLRLNQTRCTGALIWQLNDSWPGLSWSIIDADGIPKPAWESVRRAFEPRILSIQAVDGQPTLFAINESERPWQSILFLKRLSISGETVADKGIPVSIAPWSVNRLDKLEEALGKSHDPKREWLLAQLEDASTAWFYHGFRDFINSIADK
jgi:beta-mannosidase